MNQSPTAWSGPTPSEREPHPCSAQGVGPRHTPQAQNTAKAGNAPQAHNTAQAWNGGRFPSPVVRSPRQLIDRDPARPPADAAVDELHPALARAARTAAPDLAGAEVEDAVLAAAPSVAAPGLDDPATVAARIGAATAAIRQLTLPPAAAGPVDWAPFGVMLPVLAGSPGAGASVVAAALADALQLAGHRVLLVDAADPARSGLAAAAPAEGLRVRQVHPDLALRSSWRHDSLLIRMESRSPITPGMVPPPPAWLPPQNPTQQNPTQQGRAQQGRARQGPVEVTVVDVGHDGWRAAADPLVGAGGWLRRGYPVSAPVLVVRATRPSLQQAEQVLARLHRWVHAGVAQPVARLVVVAARRWPRGVTGAAGRLLTPLIDDAVFLPGDRDVELGGVTGDLMPRRLLAAATALLQEWELVDPSRRRR